MAGPQTQALEGTASAVSTNSAVLSEKLHPEVSVAVTSTASAATDVTRGLAASAAGIVTTTAVLSKQVYLAATVATSTTGAGDIRI